MLLCLFSPPTVLLPKAQGRKELVPGDPLAKTQTIPGSKEERRPALCPSRGPVFYSLLVEEVWIQWNPETVRGTDVESLLADSKEGLLTSLKNEVFVEMGQIKLPMALQILGPGENKILHLVTNAHFGAGQYFHDSPNSIEQIIPKTPARHGQTSF